MWAPYCWVILSSIKPIKKGGDRGIRLSGSNNTLTIYADRIVSYTGDEFIHVRQGNGSSVANIGSADRRIGYFEAHTGWGKDDYGVALLQANEGNKVFLYADEAVLDGSTNSQGGVIGSAAGFIHSCYRGRLKDHIK